MKISIITVCKNTKETLQETFESIFSQTYQNFELVVIDGGSTDGTLDIIEKNRDKIACFVSEPDTGVYNAMNKGIKAATGDILYFLNANDSLCDNDVFKKIVPYFQGEGNLDLLYGNIKYTRDKNVCGICKHNDFRSVLTFLDRNICHQAIFYNSQVFKKYGPYDETYKIFADYEYNVKLFVKHRIKAKYIDLFIACFETDGLSYNKAALEEEFRRIYDEYFKNNKIHKIDRFFMKFFGSPYKALKKLNQ